MNKILLTFGLIFLLFTSCRKQGEIINVPTDFIEIHGKTYKLVRIQPSGSSLDHPIWIMYPKDSTDAMPTVLNYEVPYSKSKRMETVIKLD